MSTDAREETGTCAKKKQKSSNLFTQLADTMAKPSKSQPATKPSKPPKPVLSNAERVARRENTTAYKYAKASTLASAAPRKGPRYHDADNDDNANDDDANNDDANDNNADDDNDDDADDDNDDDDEAGGRDNGGRGRSHGGNWIADATDLRPYKSGCGKYIYVANEAGEYERYKMLDRPEGSLKGLDALMEMDGPGNKALFKGIQNHVRTVVRHVSRSIPGCTYIKLTDEQRGSINAQVYKAYPIMRRYRDNWAVKELTIRALTHQRDHQARIKKAGGQVAWCNKLKAQREDNSQAKRVGNAGTTKTKGKGKTPTHVEDSEEEASNKAPLPAPGPSSSGQKTKDKVRQSSKRTAKAASTKESNEDEPTSVLKPLRVKRKAEDAPAVPNHTPKKARAQLVESSEDENIGGPKPLSSKSKGKGVAWEPVRQVTPAEVTSDDGEPAPALERPALKQKTKESQKNKVREQLIENDSEPGTISQKFIRPSARRLSPARPPRPAEVEEPASAEADLEEATQEYPPTVASITPAPAAAPRLGSDALEAGTREHDSDEDIPVPKPAQKRARPSPPPAASPPAITDDESKRKTPPTDEPTAANGKGKGANTQKAPPAKKGRKTATLAAVDDEMVGPSAAVESQAAPKGKRGRQAKQELINATDALLSDTPPVPGRKTRKSTKANKR
ncbi:hypothetical protein RhiTH_010806 [Rhizoctonia solani]